MSRAERLTSSQWQVIERLRLIQRVEPRDPRGRPRVDDRAILDGILWILRTGAPWADLPRRFPSYKTCNRRFNEWMNSGALGRILEALALDLCRRGQFDLQECFSA